MIEHTKRFLRRPHNECTAVGKVVHISNKSFIVALTFFITKEGLKKENGRRRKLSLLIAKDIKGLKEISRKL